MAILERFDPPANWHDFSEDESALAEIFHTEWSRRVDCWFKTSQVGDAWNVDNDGPRDNFFNPLGTDHPDEPDAVISWTAFPKRLLDRYETPPPPQRPLSRRQILAIADDGPPTRDNYTPSGPRGWQDEYCEWAVERNSEGKITKVTFTSENPEYWETLWFVSPQKVLDLYRQYLGTDSIELEDLIQRDRQGNPMIDPETGRPRYNRTNRWNRNQANGGENGVMHLISGPNNLFAEINLAAGATVLRQRNGRPVQDKDVLIACSRFGAAGRNSDPTIGFTVNSLVRQSDVQATLANPVGLYIQSLSTSLFELPDDAPADADPSDFWHILRGTEDHIMRAEYSVPEELGFTVSDITIDGEPIEFGAQLAEKMQIKLSAVARAGEIVPAMTCLQLKQAPLPEPVAFLEATNFERVRRFAQGSRTRPLVLLCNNAGTGTTAEISGEGIAFDQLTVLRASQNSIALVIDLFIDEDAALGTRDVTLRDANGVASPTAPCLLEVVENLALESFSSGLADEDVMLDMGLMMEKIDEALAQQPIAKMLSGE